MQYLFWYFAFLVSAVILPPGKTANTYLSPAARFGQYSPRVAVGFYRNFVFGAIYDREFYLIFRHLLISYRIFQKNKIARRKMRFVGKIFLFPSKDQPYSHSIDPTLRKSRDPGMCSKSLLISFFVFLHRSYSKSPHSQFGNRQFPTR